MAKIANLRVSTSGKLLENRHFPEWHGSCSVKSMKICQRSEAMQAQEDQVALPLRSHTILGVCEAIGEDFGFSPVLLRVPLAASVLWSPMWAIVTYFSLGLVVLASRLLSPESKADPADKLSDQSAPANEQREFAKAA
jgi:phage shock protein PspC (stress-responsive transcriptional regulator)